MLTRTALAICLTLSGFGLLQAAPALAADKQASAAETKRVQEALAKIGCKTDTVEKERDEIFEVDDAQCEIGQYDIKLDSQYRIISITRD